jgi:DNA-binding transcriptional LysR family regulator
MHRGNQCSGLNIHHLQLFYHIVMQRGVTKAAQALGKEQGTLSKQICELEKELRIKLFHRRPFELTGKGQVLLSAIEPFFSALPRLEQTLRGDDLIRIGAPHMVLRYHLPAVEKQVRRAYPRLKLVLLEANQPRLQEMLERGETDLVITLLPRDLPQKIFAQRLLQIPPILLVPKASRYTSAEQIWRGPSIKEQLISLAPDELVCQQFHETLAQKGIQWSPEIQVGSLSLIELFVKDGYGIGLSLRLPGVDFSPELRILELKEFPPLSLGMMWRNNEDKLLRLFRQHAEARAELIKSGKA